MNPQEKPEGSLMSDLANLMRDFARFTGASWRYVIHPLIIEINSSGWLFGTASQCHYL